MWILAVAGAAEWIVEPGDSVQAVLTNASAGDTLRIQAGVYDEPLEALVPVTLVGEGDVTLTAPSEANVLVAGADLTLDNLTIDGEGQRRAVYVLGTQVTIRNSTLTNGFSPGEGGLVRVDGGVLTVRGTRFEGGHALFDGGLVHVNQGGAFHAHGGVWFLDGTADDDGGGLYAADNTTVELRGVVFQNNTAQEGGGAHVASTQLVVEGASFAQNTVGDGDFDRGGGLHVNGFTDATVRYARFEGNSAASGPGIAVSNTSSLALSHSRLSGNVASHPNETIGGGALRCQLGSACVVEDSWFDDNQATAGAGISAHEATELRVDRTVLCNNAPVFGTININSTDLAGIHNSIFAKNAATSEGALDLFQLRGPVAVLNNHFVGNVAFAESAVSLSADGGFVVDLRNNLVADNESLLGPAVAGLGIVADFNLYHANIPVDTSSAGPNDQLLDPLLPPSTPGCNPDEWRLPTTSPAIDAGDLSVLDADGSPSDIGAFGGPGGPNVDDVDGDGSLGLLDCDDHNPLVHPLAPEVCDGLDNDCNGLVDDDDGGLSTPDPFYFDGDGDGFGDALRPWTVCTPPVGWASTSGDCDDLSPFTHPGAPELCDLQDNDCNGFVDDGTVEVFWYPDLDADGFGSGAPVETCDVLPGFSPMPGDCDDGDPLVNPFAVEVCDAVDNDCDTLVDNNPIDGVVGWPDSDLDGHGAGVPEVFCVLPAGWASVDGDCDDQGPSVFPGAPEFCDGLDQNCNDELDDGAVDLAWYLDSDGDGFGDAADVVTDCDVVDGRVLDGTDCDDSDPTAFPGAVEIADNGIDEDCDGEDADTGADADGDGLADGLERSVGTDPDNPDSDGDGVLDAVEVGTGVPQDTDSDGVIDALDPDDDGDGLATLEEGTEDVDDDGTPNYLDLDSDGDGVADGAEGFEDQDADGVPDVFDPGGIRPSPPPAPAAGFGCQMSSNSGWVVALVRRLGMRR